MCYDKLTNWPKVLYDLQAQIQMLRETVDPFDGPKTVLLFRNALRSHKRADILTVQSNFEAAAAHLSYLCYNQFKENELPDLPSTVLSAYQMSS